MGPVQLYQNVLAMLTVMFAARNRAGILSNVLEAFCQLQPLPVGWKLIVVDKGSAGETAQGL